MRGLLRSLEQCHTIFSTSDENTIVIELAKKRPSGPFKLFCIITDRNAERGLHFWFIRRGGCHAGEVHQREARIKRGGQRFEWDSRDDLRRGQPIAIVRDQESICFL